MYALHKPVLKLRNPVSHDNTDALHINLPPRKKPNQTLGYIALGLVLFATISVLTHQTLQQETVAPPAPPLSANGYTVPWDILFPVPARAVYFGDTAACTETLTGALRYRRSQDLELCHKGEWRPFLLVEQKA